MMWYAPEGKGLSVLTIVAVMGFAVMYLIYAPALSAQEPATPPVNYDIFLDGNSRLDARDLFRIQQLWAGSPNPVDFNRDGRTNGLDLLMFIQSFHATVSSAPTPTPSDTPSPGEPTPTPTPTATPTLGGATPTPTLVPGEETPTPTLSEATPTPTPEEAAPTPTPPPGEETPTPSEGTPTPTPEEVTPTPTPLPGEDTPTPTVTPTPEEITPTPTPPEEATPTPTPPPAPTPTPTREMGTPTPTPVGGLHFYVDFDNAITFDDIPMSSLGPEDAETLIAEERMPVINRVEPWFILDTQAGIGWGTASSEPKSAALNPNFGFYYSSQTSVLEIDVPLDTSAAVLPTLSFDAAFAFDEPFFEVGDYLVVEVRRSGQTGWEMLDLNNDGEVITDPAQFDPDNPAQPLLLGTFDALYGYSNPQNPGGMLTQADFIHLQINLPKDPALRIAFRFQSDSSISAEGIYLDNIRIVDSAGSVVEPVIRAITNLAGTAFYVDTENQALIQGEHLTPVKQVIFQSRDGVAELPFTLQPAGIAVVLPRLSNPSQGDTAILRVIREDEASTAGYNLTLEPAPVPVITAISPSPFFLNASSSVIRITGNHFRPAFEGASPDGGTRVIITTGTGDPLVFEDPEDFITRDLTTLEFDAPALKALSPGPVEVRVHNGYSGHESTPVILNLQSGAGDLVVDSFRIELGFGLYSFDPATGIYPLQTDQSFSLLWQMSNFTPALINIDIAGKPFVTNGQAVGATGKVSAFLDPLSGVSLELAPLVLDGTGTITASIRLANGTPVDATFTLFDPYPPLLYTYPDDWSTQTLSISSENTLMIVGDNFRGLGTGATDRETITRAYLIPVESANPDADKIALPVIQDVFDYYITPQIGVAGAEDVLYQNVPANLFSVPEGETRRFRLRVENPDSGLFTDSAPELVVTFTP
ncbi:MAG TPA: hypothetical protein PLH79_03310 [bacterium]|nr:hypothetical protein [bacterium]